MCVAYATKNVRGWHLLGDILKPFKVGEELLAVLFAMLLGKPTHSYNAPNIGAGTTIRHDTRHTTHDAHDTRRTRHTWGLPDQALKS
jgi:hypothetical protein